jgi:hypothetical protein
MDGYVPGLLTCYPKNDRASGECSGFTSDQYGILNLYTGVCSGSGARDVQLFARNVTNTKRTLTPLREFGITA